MTNTAINRALRRQGFTQAEIEAGEQRQAARAAASAEQMRQYKANVTQPDGFAVTCGHCNYTGNFDDFVKDRLGFERPANTFQCPQCSFAIRRQVVNKHIQLQPIQPTL